MRKTAYFCGRAVERWPNKIELEEYFFAPQGRRFFESGTDSASLDARGLYGTESLEQGKGRIDVVLFLWGHPEYGVYLSYQKRDGDYGDAYVSMGDLGRLGEWVETTHEDLASIGLFISVENAWKAVREFVETGGELPKAIEWIRADDLPSHAFPEPGTVSRDHPNVRRRFLNG